MELLLTSAGLKALQRRRFASLYAGEQASQAKAGCTCAAMLATYSP